MSRVRVSEVVRPEILAASPYAVADARGLVKLDAMEAPTGLPPALLKAWQDWVAEADWHRYPDGGAQAVKAGLRRQFAIADSLGLLLGNGSDEIIQMLCLALARPDACLMTPEPGFAIFRAAATTAGMGYHPLALDPEDFSLDPQRAVAAIEREKPALVFVANPNNPTGNRFPRETLLALAEATPGLVVIDEAYFPHSREHCLDLAGRPDNVAVMRTLSKAGMAGLRLGWLVAAPEWVDALERVRMPYNINVFTQLATRFALAHPDWWQNLAASLREQRLRLHQALEAIPGLRVWPSEANFLLVRVREASAVHAAMKEAGVLVKCLHGQHPALTDCLRLTVGSEAENTRLLEALTAALNRR
ncbi:histidinol-phosphate transaminase [Natronospira bacteriovora]|uniref:Histidinol-phosphate aminotransferase n=1 Tax=Natronospira bacteriovora TaxID=3069753 RepID=A0ABU0W679_9GAMM|nr:histidinol-phosphate transaminase [Natronospira sp. AB-CW4]MDQ2069528.1 histidinol-phosphate transaminase [Natronospira sp. AB-CW4]